MPHLVHKVKLDNALDQYISEVVDLNSHGHRYRQRDSNYGNLVPSLHDKLIAVN
jgi:hypothetical protein